ncbi:hypothetical protein NDU88_002064 [Pleurodeles waltl]|uniref:Uncharacterized protein n=1 Tax=Pleurodeles waltl TaxID=8319 RepID=A0AAV7NHI0_PLEWA|nr:hypothetical protein NDU88_002064 [Pleurodeles waltl]
MEYGVQVPVRVVAGIAACHAIHATRWRGGGKGAAAEEGPQEGQAHEMLLGLNIGSGGAKEARKVAKTEGARSRKHLLTRRTLQGLKQDALGALHEKSRVA